MIECVEYKALKDILEKFKARADKPSFAVNSTPSPSCEQVKDQSAKKKHPWKRGYKGMARKGIA